MIDKVGRFCLPIKSANKKLLSVIQKNWPILSADKIVRFYC